MSNMFGTIYTKSGFVPDCGLCIDWETSGSNFDGDSSIDYQGIAFGSMIKNINGLTPLKRFTVLQETF